jgi:hypothetical protein
VEESRDHEGAETEDMNERRNACGHMLSRMNFKPLRLRISGRMGGMGGGGLGENTEAEDDDENERLDTTGLGVFL